MHALFEFLSMTLNDMVWSFGTVVITLLIAGATINLGDSLALALVFSVARGVLALELPAEDPNFGDPRNP